MPFPEVPRIIFSHNPLDLVVCQLRFPPILKIDAEIPYAFQERINDHFPFYSETGEINIKINQPKGEQIPPELVKEIVKSQGYKTHTFQSEDKNWIITLTRIFISLTTKNYLRWEEFLEKLNTPLQALYELYDPKFYTRVGLRYINIIERSKLNLENTAWSELLNAHILGLLGSNEISSKISAFENKYELKLSDDESIVRIITELVKSIETDKIAYKLDFDFYNTNKTGREEAMDKLNFFNARSSRLIRWCITDRLFEAMEPGEI